MKQKGFTYIAKKRVGEAPANSLTSSGVLDRKKYVSEYGFGISTFPDNLIFSVDPNDAIFKSLSDAEEDSYMQALTGATRGGKQTPGSCQGQFLALEKDPRLISLSNKLNSELADLEKSEAGQKIHLEWEKCFINKTGLKFKSSQEVSDSVSRPFDDPTTDRSVLALEEKRLARAAFDCDESSLQPLKDLKQTVTSKFLAKNREQIDQIDVPEIAGDP